MNKIRFFLFETYFRDRLVLVSSIITFILNIILWLILLGKFGLSKELIPLHFNVVYGIDFVGKASKIYQLPGSGLIIFLVNSLLSALSFTKEKFLSYLLIFASMAVQFILLLAALSVFFLNA